MTHRTRGRTVVAAPTLAAAAFALAIAGCTTEPLTEDELEQELGERDDVVVAEVRTDDDELTVFLELDAVDDPGAVSDLLLDVAARMSQDDVEHTGPVRYRVTTPDTVLSLPDTYDADHWPDAVAIGVETGCDLTVEDDAQVEDGPVASVRCRPDMTTPIAFVETAIEHSARTPPGVSRTTWETDAHGGRMERQRLRVSSPMSPELVTTARTLAALVEELGHGQALTMDATLDPSRLHVSAYSTEQDIPRFRAVMEEHPSSYAVSLLNVDDQLVPFPDLESP